MKLTGNTILITGGTSGIGFQLAQDLIQKGNTVIITGRDSGRLERAKKKLPQVHTVQSDVSQAAAIEALAERVTREYPDMNVLINNAGIMRAINIHEKTGSLEDFTQEIDTNLKGPIRMVKAFLPHLKKKPSSAIVNVSSGLAFVPLPIAPIYCATKAALHSFTDSLRVQLKNTKVKVYEVAPPATRTELMESFDPSDMKGVTLMNVEELVRLSLNGIEQDRGEIRPGQSNQLKFMSRLAPGFILKQLSKPVERMLSATNN